MPHLGSTAEFREVGIATLHIAQVDAGTGAEQLQGQVGRGMLEGDDHHRDSLRRRCRNLQRQCRFAHAGRASEQVQSLVEATQEVIELREASRHTQHSAAGRLPLQAACFCVRQDLGQQGAGPP